MLAFKKFTYLGLEKTGSTLPAGHAQGDLRRSADRGLQASGAEHDAGFADVDDDSSSPQLFPVVVEELTH
jgi:hypothetical protein